MKQTFGGAHLTAAALLSVLGICAAGAEDLSSDAMIQALTPKAATRSLASSIRPNPAQKDDEVFIDSLRGKASRSLTVSDRSKLQTVSADKPNLDLTMEFGYASAVLRPDAMATADKLGKALSDPGLQNKTFVLAGHTDAKGTDDTNQRLSERRAEAVKEYLVKHYAIKPANLIAVGYGKGDLKDPKDPFGSENRRVQTVNVMPYQSAGK